MRRASTCSAPFSRAWPTSAADIARLDAELVRRGLARSRGQARDLVESGVVRVAGRVARKPSQAVAADSDVQVSLDEPQWVGRAAHKLVAALDSWMPRGLLVHGRRCIDVGASTGGFTQVLLAHGAGRVLAVDVGQGQLAPGLRSHPRVEDLSGTTVRGLTAADVGGPGDLVVVDLSFISLTLVLPELAGLTAPEGDVIALVKPQFEVGRGRLPGSGVVTEVGDRAAAVLRVVAAAHDAGLYPRGLLASPLRGTAGNAEYLLWARPDPSDTMSLDQVRASVRAITADESPGGR